MIKNIIEQMLINVKSLQQDILEDIEDVKKANHEKLLDRNDIKLEKMKNIAASKEELNGALVHAVQSGEDVNIYRDDVDKLEANLLELSSLNARLASIVLPVKEMYKEIIDEITASSGGSLLEVRA
ncbi:MAG: hypothetical protein DRG78_21575 [Epsilonproteobacteria bacterium]|nr:MAG: hypothetical protein DRG78_21575 [Campylobacterota bacterium]